MKFKYSDDPKIVLFSMSENKINYKVYSVLGVDYYFERAGKVGIMQIDKFKKKMNESFDVYACYQKV